MSNRAPSWLLSGPIAHRGLHGPGAPELSAAALQRAVDAGLAAEIDVRLSRDGTVVVIHDADTERVTGVRHVVAETDADALTALTATGTTEKLLTLRGALAVVAGRVPLLIELKHGVAAATVGPAVVTCLDGYAGPWAVQSFDPRIVRWFARHAPDVARGQISGDLSGEGLPLAGRLLLETMAANGLSRPDFLAYEVDALSRRSVALWRRVLRCPVVAWTVRTPEQAQRARSLHAGIIFEDMDPPPRF